MNLGNSTASQGRVCDEVRMCGTPQGPGGDASEPKAGYMSATDPSTAIPETSPLANAGRTIHGVSLTRNSGLGESRGFRAHSARRIPIGF